MNYRRITAGAILAVALLAGGFSYFCFHYTLSMSGLHVREHDSLLWVRQEFKLSGEKLARVEALHQAYELICAEHCLAIAESREALTRAQAAHGSPAQIAAAAAKVKEVDALCLASTEAHIREVAAVIGGEEGRRYLAIVLPRVANFDHRGPASLDLHSSTTHEP